jgi:hypothetical protein
MATTREEICTWLDRAAQVGATHMLVVVDTFDYENYPVQVMIGENVNDKIAKSSSNMQRVMECYNFSLPLDAQLDEHRAWNL